MDKSTQHSQDEENNRQISIWLDSYDDVFSDFDPRPYSERALSDDFIAELKKVSREEEFGVGELRLLVSSKNRKQESEPIIVKRVHAYFRRGNYYLLRRVKNTRFNAILITLAGMSMILLASFISGVHSDKFYMKVLFVLVEPAGWFFIWTGMDDLFFAPRKRKEELDFFAKMAKAKIIFASF